MLILSNIRRRRWHPKGVKPEKLQPGQESVWSYPRPPRMELSSKQVRVEFGGVVIGESTRCFRILETSHPPTWYLPPDDILSGSLVAAAGKSFCEFKGSAVYWTVRAGNREAPSAAWSYPAPSSSYLSLRDYVAFYPSHMDACFVDGERVLSQAGDFYGGWITSDVIGPFKGGPGTSGW